MSDYPIRFQDDEMFFEGSPMDALPVALAQIKLMQDRIAELEAENERLKRSCGRVERDLMAALKVQLDLASERDRARAALEDSA